MLLKYIFEKNEYPQFFIDKCIKNKKLFVPKSIIHTVRKRTNLIDFTFFRSCLQKCFKNYIPYCSLKVVYQFKNKIANAFNLKDVANTKLSSHTFINLCVVAATQLIITLLTDKLLKHLFLIICYWMVIKQVSTIFGYF